MRKIAVFGVGRSGTTMIYKILQDILYNNTGNRLNCVYEPFLWDRNTFDQPYELVTGKFEDVSALSYEGIYHHKKLPLFITDTYKLGVEQGRYIKNLLTPLQRGNSLLIKFIRANGRYQLFKQCSPDLKSIFIIRNPLDVINSVINRFSYYGDDFYVSDYPRLFQEVSNGLISPLPNIISESCGQREFLYWYTMNKYFLERYGVDKDVLIICYENYVKDKKFWIEKICSFLDIEFEFNFLDNVDRVIGPTAGEINIEADDYSFLKPFVYDYIEMVKQQNISVNFDINEILMRYENRKLNKRCVIVNQGKGSIFLREKLNSLIKTKNGELVANKNLINSLYKEIAAKNDEIRTTKNDLATKEVQLKELITSITKREEQFAKLELLAADSLMALERAEADRKAMKTEIKRHARQIVKLNASIARLEEIVKQREQ
jgi:hypothetical protein